MEDYAEYETSISRRINHEDRFFRKLALSKLHAFTSQKQFTTSGKLKNVRSIN
jgi:hypothetical protein